MKLLIVDATNNFVRNYAVVPTLTTNGEPNGGVVGFLRSLGFFCRITSPDKIILVWDGPGGSKKRKAILKDYKEGRKPLRLNRNFEFELVDVEKNKVDQRIRLGLYLKDLPVYQLSIPDVEADDVVGYLVKMFYEDEKVIVSNDKDFYQLVSDKVSVFSPTKKMFMTDKVIYETFGIHPNNFALARALVGDESDNIKGIKGIGFKTLIKKFPFMSGVEKVTLDQLFKYCEENGEKFKRFLDDKQVIIDNHQVMQLENPIIGIGSIHKIEESLQKEIVFNATSFRMKLYEDGVTTFTDSFFQPFRCIIAKKG